MQFRLRSLFILTALICVYLGVLNAPSQIALPLFCAAVWVTPAYWIAGVIYARDARRAFFIGGLAAGAAPFLVLLSAFGFRMGDPWGWGYQPYQVGETQAINMVLSLFVFAPVLLAFIGGWIALAMYHNLQPSPSVRNVASGANRVAGPLASAHDEARDAQ
jgi:hypothetical protein